MVITKNGRMKAFLRGDLEDYELPDEEIQRALEALPKVAAPKGL